MTTLCTTNIASASEIFSDKERAIIPISAFTASGEIEKLTQSLNDGLDAGLTVNEIKEVLAQLYAYAGFPRSLNGLATFMTVLEERKSQGITDTLGRESSALPNDKTSLEFGAENQTQLVGAEVKGALFDFSPQIDEYLKAHLFGDIFERDVLTWKEREIATIAALANMNGVNSQLAAHYNISMNNNVSIQELEEFIVVLIECCG
ncbi:TPA: carboxymuconolactone decarboxylase family protein, partial [Vibrio diabolicus]